MGRLSMRFTVVLLLLTLLTGATVFAADTEVLSLPEEAPPVQKSCGLLRGGIPLAYEEPTETHNLRLLGSTSLTLEETLAEGCRARQQSIDVSAYRISEAAMPDLFTFFVMKHSELMVGAGYGYTWSQGSDGVKRITKIRPVYLFSDEEMPEVQQKWQGYLDEYVTEAKQFIDPLEQALYVHDKLVLNCVYASEAANKLKNGTLTKADFIYWHPYTLFDQGSAVCQGYAQAFYEIMKELGFEVDYCFNSGHVWNYLMLGDKWYHVDATWDDPVPDREGLVGHNYFLRTDASMDDHVPDEWISSLGFLPECTSTAYESGYLFNLSNGKTIVKEEYGYRMTCWNMDFVSDRLWTGKVLVTAPNDGKIKYVYLEEPESSISIYTARKDGEGILRGGGASTRTGETMYNSTGSLALRSYTLPTGPASATSGAVYFRDSGTQKPCGPTFQF